MKRCRSCNVELTDETWAKGNSKQNNKICRKCDSNRRAERYHREKSESPEEIKEKSKKRWESYKNRKREEDPVRWRAYHMVRSAKCRRGKCSLDVDYVHSLCLPTCPILGIEIDYCREGAAGYNSPSLDRIDNRQGYEIGNVQVISNRANMLKNSATLDELILFSEWVAKERVKWGT